MCVFVFGLSDVARRRVEADLQTNLGRRGVALARSIHFSRTSSQQLGVHRLRPASASHSIQLRSAESAHACLPTFSFSLATPTMTRSAWALKRTTKHRALLGRSVRRARVSIHIACRSARQEESEEQLVWLLFVELELKFALRTSQAVVDCVSAKSCTRAGALPAFANRSYC